MKLVAEEVGRVGLHELDADSSDGFSRRQEGEAFVEVGSCSSGCCLERRAFASSTSMSSLSDSFAALWNAGAMMIVFVYFAYAQSLKTS